MKNVKPRTHEQMHGRPTSWEVIFVYPDGETRIGFTQAKTKENLWRFAKANFEIIEPILIKNNCPDNFKKWNKNILDFGNICYIKYGRTERTVATLEMEK